MKCPHCGAKNPDNAVFCIQCNEWIFPSVFHSQKQRLQKQQSRKNGNGKRPIFTALTICIILLCCSFLIPKLSQRNPSQSATKPEDPEKAAQWIECRNDVTAVAQDGMIAFLQNEYYIPTSAPMGEDKGQYSFDGSTMAIVSQDKRLLFLQDGVYHEVSGNVKNYCLSPEGNALAYHTDQELRLYQADGTDCLLSKISQNQWITQLIISPDGNTVYYVLEDGKQNRYPLYRYHADSGASSVIVPDFERYTLLAAPNNSSMVYACDAYYLYAFTNSGEKQDLGAFTTFLSSTVSSRKGTSFYLSADHQQILFFYQGETYFTADGQKATKISEQLLHFITPQGATEVKNSDLVSTLPTRQLLGKLMRKPQYQSKKDSYGFPTVQVHYDILMLQENHSTRTLAEMTQKCWLSIDNTLYFTAENNNVMRIQNFDDENLEVLARFLGEQMVVDANHAYLYFYEKDSLRVINATTKDKPTTNKITWTDPTGASTLCMTSNGLTYLLSKRTLDTNGPIESRSKVFDQIVTTENGGVYIHSNGIWYRVFDDFISNFQELENQ